MNKLSILIPVYNEQDTILPLIKHIESVQLPGGLDKEMIIVDDGSTDETHQRLKTLSSNPTIKVFFQETNQGKGSAVRRAIQESTGDIILIQDADLEYLPDNYPALLEPILSQKTSIVYGSRFKGNIKDMAFINRLANRISNITINLLYGTELSDIQTCFKVFKSDLVKNLQLSSDGFSLDTELTAKLLNQKHRIYEVPITYVARHRKEGKKMTWGKALTNYFALLRYSLFKGTY